MSDILIRMDMPHDCSRCSVKVDPDTRQCCVDKHLFEETLSVLISRRDKDCPLIELPPHGDLIDMDKIRYTELYGGVEVTTANWIDSLPVVVPAERREGDGD